MWFTMGETRRANREQERANQEWERANRAEERVRQAEERLRQAREQVRQLEAELWATSLAEIQARLAALTADAADLRRRLDERAAAAAVAKADKTPITSPPNYRVPGL